MPFFEPVQHDIWDKLAQEKRPLLLYGMGDGADKLIAHLDMLGIPYADVFASDGFVRGQFFHGKKVLSLSQAKAKYGDFLTALSFASEREEVVAQIRELAKQMDILVPDLPIAGEVYFDKDFYNAHLDELNDTYMHLADEHSRQVLASVVKAKLHGNPSDLFAFTTTEAENAQLLPFKKMVCAVDGGAYRGDSAAFLIKHAPNLKALYAIEPDRRTFAKLSAYAERDPRIKPIHGALTDKEGTVTF